MTSRSSCLPVNNFEIRASQIPGAGFGVYATHDLSKGTFLGTYVGKIFSPVVYSKMVVDGDLSWGYGFDVESGNYAYVIDASDKSSSNWTRYMNCSRNLEEENVYFEDEGGQINFYALRLIKKGEELLFFYGDSYAEALGLEYRSPLY